MVKQSEHNPEMLKEIFAQSHLLQTLIESPINFDSILCNPDVIDLIYIIACGSSFNSSLVGKSWLESLANIPTSVISATEIMTKKKLLLSPHTLVIVVSQSGKTFEVLSALEHNFKDTELQVNQILGITNHPLEKIANLVDVIIPLNCGEETAIPATKTYTSSLMIFFQLALNLATMRNHLNLAEINKLKSELIQIPDLIRAYLPEQISLVKKLALILEKSQHILLLGRHNDYGTVLEGALKIQETSYTHAQGFFTGEFKHGPRALINEQTPIIMITNCEHDTYKMTLKDAELYQKQGGLLIGVTQQTSESNGIFAHTLPIGNISPILAPILNIIPLQMLACHLALIRGLDPDHPRNLTKAVTQITI